MRRQRNCCGNTKIRFITVRRETRREQRNIVLSQLHAAVPITNGKYRTRQTFGFQSFSRRSRVSTTSYPCLFKIDQNCYVIRMMTNSNYPNSNLETFVKTYLRVCNWNSKIYYPSATTIPILNPFLLHKNKLFRIIWLCYDGLKCTWRSSRDHTM